MAKFSEGQRGRVNRSATHPTPPTDLWDKAGTIAIVIPLASAVTQSSGFRPTLMEQAYVVLFDDGTGDQLLESLLIAE